MKREDQPDRKKKLSKWRPEDQVPILEALVATVEFLCSSSEVAGQIHLQIGERQPEEVSSTLAQNHLRFPFTGHSRTKRKRTYST